MDVNIKPSVLPAILLQSFGLGALQLAGFRPQLTARRGAAEVSQRK